MHQCYPVLDTITLMAPYIYQRDIKCRNFFMTVEQAANLEKEGFAIINDIYSLKEIKAITDLIGSASDDKPAFRKSNDLFAIRQFLREIPTIKPLLFTDRFCSLIKALFGTDYFVVKSIYFDKPPASNWFVSYHQDLTIAVNQKAVIHGFDNWTVKQHQYAVQPPLAVLQNNFTIRIHLDDTDKNNGALKVIPGSHVKGILRPETLNLPANAEVVCNVKKRKCDGDAAVTASCIRQNNKCRQTPCYSY